MINLPCFKKNRKLRKNAYPCCDAGFTLIEMLVVIAVIGILSSVLLTALGPAKLKAKDTRIVQEVNQARTIIEGMWDGDYDEVPQILACGTLNNVPESLVELAEDIEMQGGCLIIKKTSSLFVVYSGLNVLVKEGLQEKINYICMDSIGRAKFITDEPQGSNYSCQ